MKKNFSRVASLVLAVMMLISLLPANVLAAGAGTSVGGICGEDVEWSYTDGTLSLSGTGAVYDYSADDNYTTNPPPWFDLRDEITAIEISEGITRLGDFSLVGCVQMTGIKLPSTLVAIGERVFMDWISLVEIEIPESVAIIEDGAFEWNDRFEKVTIYNKNTEFGSGVFEACGNLSIYGYGLSTAQNYATENNIRFVELSQEESGTDAPEDTDVVTEKLVTGTISFPEDAYLEGGSLIVDVWTRGQITGEYKKVEFEIDSLEDVDFEFLFPADETAVSTRVMLRNLSGAETNLYTDTSSNLDFTLTENGMEDTYEFHYIDIEELATKEILMPCGKMISGTISGDNLQFVDNACLTLVFGNYWTRAFIDVETHEYTAVMPYGITEGYYAASVENSSENATSNILNGQYYYTESESVTINPAENLTDLNFTVDTGYAVSGEVTIPENAVLDNYNITSMVQFNGEPYYVTGLTTKPAIGEENRSVPFMFGVDKNTDTISTSFKLDTYGYMADDMLSSTPYSNVLVDTSYYYSEQGTTLNETEATVVTIDSDIEDIVFELQIGTVINAEITVPESVSEQYIWYDFYAVSLEGDIIAELSERTMPENDVNYAQLVIPATYEEVYLMYKVDYDTDGAYPDIYTGKAYVNADGSVTGFRSDADSHSTYGDITLKFELAEFKDVEIPDAVESNGIKIESDHPYRSNTTREYTYTDSDANTTSLEVTFSPLSWINEYLDAKISITDGNGNTKKYTIDEFNKKVSGETITVDGSEFTVTITTPYVSSYSSDYGFAVVGVEGGSGAVTPDVPEEYLIHFNAMENGTTNVIPNATIIITNPETASTADAIELTADEGGWASVMLPAGTYTVTTWADGYETSIENITVIEESTYPLFLEKFMVTPDVPQLITQTFFIVFDKETRQPVPNALISVIPADSAMASGAISLMTDETGLAFADLPEDTYTVTTTAGDYVKDTRNVTISGNAQEVVIELERPEISIAANTTFTVLEGEKPFAAISGANITIEDAPGKKYTLKTDASGNASVDLEDGTYSVGVIADGYKVRSFKIERSDEKNHFTVYLNKREIIDTKSTVKELTKEEAENAGIDTSAPGNRHVYNCSTVLSFIPTKTINYVYNEKGEVVKGETVVEDNVAVTPVAKDVYLIVKSSVAWLKEIFEVQLVCTNTSGIETIEDLTATLNIPDGLSLAIMKDSEQNNAAQLGDVAPEGQAETVWYICGDEEGEYQLDGTITGTRVGGGISEDINLAFGIKDAISVLAGTAMKLTIEAEKTAYAGSPYRMRYTLENVSKKTLYDLSFTVLGGKFFEKYGIVEAEYAKEFGPEGVRDLNGEGFIFETKEFKPDEGENKISGVFTITFGEGLDLTDGTKYNLEEAFTITGAGSTTVIPTEIIWKDSLPAHNWDGGTVTVVPTCTTDGLMTYKCIDYGCEEAYTEIIPATKHAMGEWTVIEGSCTIDTVMTRKCANCDYEISLVTEAPGHDMSDWWFDGDATCENASSRSRKCSRCDYTETESFTALGHDWETEFTVDKEATCTESGSQSRHCSRCDATKDTAIIPALGHDMSDWWIVKNATCVENGTKIRKCANCDYSESILISATDHNWDNGIVTKPATETENGIKVYTCENGCGETWTEILPKLLRQEVSFPIPEFTITYGDYTSFYNTAYNSAENGSALIYSSSNEDVATVDSDGKVTIHSAGETTITATAPATEIYLESSASFKLTVNKVKGYAIELGNLSQKRGSVTAVTAQIVPQDATATIKLEYQGKDGSWSETLPSATGRYRVRAALTESKNIVVSEGAYTYAYLQITASAIVDFTGNGEGMSVDTYVNDGKVEFLLDKDDINEILNNVPSDGNVTVDATEVTAGVNELTLPAEFMDALSESDKIESLKVVAEDAEIEMSDAVLKTVAENANEGDKVSFNIDAVNKSKLNDEQKKALEMITTDAVVLELNLTITSTDNEGNTTEREIYQLGGDVAIRTKYSLPPVMQGKTLIICYLSENGTPTFIRASYKDGYVSFDTNHFSHYAIMVIECPHEWNDGEIVKAPTEDDEGVKRYTCSLCDETKDESIPKKSATMGDANGDGEINFVDAILVLKHDAGISKLSEEILPAMDTNGDGSVDFTDAILILKYDAGLISEFN